MHALAPAEGASAGTEPGSEVSLAYSAMTEGDSSLSMAYEDASTQEAAGDDADTVLQESARRLNDHYRQDVPLNDLYNEKQSRVWVCTRAADGATGFVVKLTKASVSVPAGVEVSDAIKRHRRMAARELSILRKLDSEYLVRLEDSFVNDGFLYTVFRRFWGNLHDVYDQRFRKNAPFSDADVRAVATRLLRALEYLHFSLRVVHRDIKLANVLMPAPDAFDACVLTDVGHSRELGTLQLAGTRTSLGTRGFQPPELAFHQPHTRAVDMYQVGVVIFTLVTGSGPHRIDIAAAIHDNRHYEALEQLAINEGARKEARRRFIDRLMAFRADERGTPRTALSDPWLNGTAE